MMIDMDKVEGAVKLTQVSARGELQQMALEGRKLMIEELPKQPRFGILAQAPHLGWTAPKEPYRDAKPLPFATKTVNVNKFYGV